MYSNLNMLKADVKAVFDYLDPGAVAHQQQRKKEEKKDDDPPQNYCINYAS